jgi:hypothetical protein
MQLGEPRDLGQSPRDEGMEEPDQTKEDREALHTAAIKTFQRLRGDYKAEEGYVASKDHREELQAINNTRDEFEDRFKRLPQNEAIAITEQARAEVYNLPDGMYLSPKAYERFLQQTSSYKFIAQKKLGLLGHKADISPESEHFDFRGELGENIIALSADNIIIGATDVSELEENRESLWIGFQEGGKNNPGVGLAMLKKVIELAPQQGFKKIVLFTNQRPAGLGNLDFKPFTDPQEPSRPYFSLDLEANKAKQSGTEYNFS